MKNDCMGYASTRIIWVTQILLSKYILNRQRAKINNRQYMDNQSRNVPLHYRIIKYMYFTQIHNKDLTTKIYNPV